MKKNIIVAAGIILSFAFITPLFGLEEGRIEKTIVIKGRFGSEDGEFGLKVFEDRSSAEPSGIAIDSKGNIYIADPLNNRIQKFDSAGKFLFKISLDIQKKLQRFAMTIDDLAVDQEDNLYAVSRHEQKIFKYNKSGTLIQTVNLKKLEIAWDRWRGWRGGGYFQSEGISVDVVGNIYLEGFNELIKFNRDGRLDKKWVRESGSYFLDRKGYLYFSKGVDTWEKYDQHGNLLGTVVCEKEPLLAFIPKDGGRCQFPPKFIDKNGFRYYFELKEKTSDLASIFKVNQTGNSKKYIVPPIDIGQTPNMIKLDIDGNLYVYGSDYTKKEYWIVRISLN